MAKAGEMSSPQLRGYLFGIILEKLIGMSGFTRVDPASEPERIREVRRDFTELRGIGCWHHIDLPFDYSRSVPFSAPLRLLGEVKFVKDPVEKSNVRSFIGVLRDIEEGTRADGADAGRMRHKEAGAFFSASGFNSEAERLAYAHGIRTVSYADTPVLDRVKEIIIDIEKYHLSADCVKDGAFGDVTAYILRCIKAPEDGEGPPEEIAKYTSDGFAGAVRELGTELAKIQSSFFAVTDTGVLLHVIGEAPFPAGKFAGCDRVPCSLVLGTKGRGGNGWWLEIGGEADKYYFTPPGNLSEAELFGSADRGGTPRTLRVQREIGGINRDLVLEIEEIRPMI